MHQRREIEVRHQPRIHFLIVGAILEHIRMLQVEHAVLQYCFAVNRLVNKVERLDTTGIDLHQTVAPCVEGIVDGVGELLLRLWTVVVRIVAYLYLLDIDNSRTRVLNS